MMLQDLERLWKISGDNLTAGPHFFLRKSPWRSTTGATFVAIHGFEQHHS
jgi:hypothetical protein